MAEYKDGIWRDAGAGWESIRWRTSQHDPNKVAYNNYLQRQAEAANASRQATYSSRVAQKNKRDALAILKPELKMQEGLLENMYKANVLNSKLTDIENAKKSGQLQAVFGKAGIQGGSSEAAARDLAKIQGLQKEMDALAFKDKELQSTTNIEQTKAKIKAAEEIITAPTRVVADYVDTFATAGIYAMK